jgi:hypothetical protein
MNLENCLNAHSGLLLEDERYSYAVKNVSFVIPSSCLSVVNSVDSSFLGDKGVPTFEAINRYSPRHIPEQDLNNMCF